MHEGTWQIQKDGELFKADVVVGAGDRVLYFEGAAGEYSFLR